MIVDRHKNTTIITQEKASALELVKKLEIRYERFKKDNIIIHLTNLLPFSKDSILEFLHISNRHRKAKNSFVIVCANLAFEEVIEEIVVVPTLQEANDVIQMEDIERDLGF